MPVNRVLILQNRCEDAADLARTLRSAGFTTEVATQPAAVLNTIETGGCRLVLLDDSIAEKQGSCICAQIKSAGQDIPVMFVTTNDTVDCRLASFKSGADDFVSRPFNPEELILRINAVLRRFAFRPIQFQCRLGATIVDLAAGEAVRDDQRLRLTAKETHLFRYLWTRREQVVSKAELLRNVWEYSAHDTRTVDVHVAMLRRKLEVEPHRPRHLMTLRSKGYLLRCTYPYVANAG